MNNDFVRQGYNKIADNYLDKRDVFKNRKYLDKLIELLPTGSTILDIGCGAGTPIDSYLVSKGFKIVGIDISERQIELAKKHVPKGNYERKDMSEISEKEYKVDAVISFYAIFHIPRETHPELFRKIRSFIPKNGYTLVTMGHSDWVGTENDFFGGEMAWSHFDAKKNKDIIKEAGFDIVFDEIDISGDEKHLIVLAKKT
jgi:cyclopropane fatty-acyl-phospholipid synthase-like methyltransferase